MSIHNFDYSVESLQKDKIKNLEKDLEAQTKLVIIKHIDISDKLETFNNLHITELRVEECQLKYGETNMIIKGKFFLDINKSIEDIKINLKYSEQDMKNKLVEKKKGIFWTLLT